MPARSSLPKATIARRSPPAVRRFSRWLVVPVAVAAGALAAVAPATAAQPVSGIPDLTGAWVRVDATGSGSFDNLAAGFPQASLTPAYAEQQERERKAGPRTGAWDPNKKYQNGEAYVVTGGTCGFPGGIEPNSAAFHIVQDRDEVVIVRENPGLGRNIYMDGRPHPDLKRFVPTATGHSVGRYEGGALVFQTIGLTAGGVPAGGYKTPETVLVERYSLSPDGNRLTMRYTFTDPKIYTKPHTFEILAERGLPKQLAFEWYCDAADPKQSQGVAPPKQE
jgi:hypothetical protein